MKYGFIGLGNIAQAIYKGLKNDNNLNFVYTDKNGNFYSEVSFLESIEEVVSLSDVIWLCVKPQDLEEVLWEMKKLDLENKVVISPVAGKPTSFIQKELGEKATIVRIMPNLAIAYQKSVTAFYANNMDLGLVKKVKDDLAKLGEVVALPEEQFDLFTAVFGSGPAFILEVLKSFQTKITEFELDTRIADRLLLGLLEGTTAYLKNSYQEENVDNLVKKVTSKGGTTEAGLDYFLENNLGNFLKNVIMQAEERGKKLGSHK